MTLNEPHDSVKIGGHNCKIEIGSGNTIAHLLITGHNNKVHSKGESSSAYGMINQIEVTGHNNRLESITANNLKVTGHHNKFHTVVCSNINDSGMNTKFDN